MILEGRHSISAMDRFLPPFEKVGISGSFDEGTRSANEEKSPEELSSGSCVVDAILPQDHGVQPPNADRARSNPRPSGTFG